MKWQNGKPKKSDNFLISAKIGNRIFSYVAYYNLQEEAWYEYDPLTGVIGEILKIEVLGWTELESFGGFV